jgi:hypothetical protein
MKPDNFSYELGDLGKEEHMRSFKHPKILAIGQLRENEYPFLQ